MSTDSLRVSVGVVDDWHEAYIASPVVDTVAIEAARQMEAARRIASWIDEHVDVLRQFLRDAREQREDDGEGIVEVPDDYEELGCCPECGGFFSCTCDEWRDYGGDTPRTPDVEDEDEEDAKCPCCGYQADRAELFYPYCSNHCFKHRDE